MRKLVCFGFLAILASACLAVTHGEAAYIGGTSSAVKAGDTGVMDVSSPTEFVFSTTTAKLPIAYDSLQRVEYHNEVAFHLGVVPAIAVGLLKERERKHFLTLTYVDNSGVKQVAVFEVPKDAPGTLLAIFGVRATHACILSQRYTPCPATTVREQRKPSQRP